MILGARPQFVRQLNIDVVYLGLVVLTLLIWMTAVSVVEAALVPPVPAAVEVIWTIRLVGKDGGPPNAEMLSADPALALALRVTELATIPALATASVGFDANSDTDANGADVRETLMAPLMVKLVVALPLLRISPPTESHALPVPHHGSQAFVGSPLTKSLDRTA